MTKSLLTSAQRAAAARVFDSSGRRFSQLIEAAGLSPEGDLRAKPLRRIVLQPDEDVSGYDFSGSDLSGAVLRRVDLSRVNLTDTILYGADLRGAELSNHGLTSSQMAAALTGPLPPALRQGPNRLWPADLFEKINGTLADCSDDDTLFFAAQEILKDDQTARLAEHLFRTLLDWREIALRKDHENTLTTRHELARAILDQGRAKEAEVALAELLPIKTKVFGDQNLETLVTRHTLALSKLEQGRAKEAEESFKEIVSMLEQVLDPIHQTARIARFELARSILNQGRAADAEATLRELLQIEEMAGGPEHKDTLVVRHERMRALMHQGDTATAAIGFQELLATMEKINGPGHGHTLTTRRELAHAALHDGRVQLASDLLHDFPLEHAFFRGRRIVTTHLVFAMLADALGNDTDAEQHLSSAQEAMTLLVPEAYERRMVDHYIATRTPGKPGGTTLWMLESAQQRQND